MASDRNPDTKDRRVFKTVGEMLAILALVVVSRTVVTTRGATRFRMSKRTPSPMHAPAAMSFCG